MRLVLGIEQCMCRLSGKRTKGEVHEKSAQLLPAWPLELIRKTTGEAQEDHYAKTLLSSQPFHGGLCWSQLMVVKKFSA